MVSLSYLYNILKLLKEKTYLSILRDIVPNTFSTISMNNNPFLKQMNSDDRFKFLDNEIVSSSKGKNKKNVEYKPSENSFIQHSKYKEHVNQREHVKRNNAFKTKECSSTPINVIDTNNIELFPDLIPIKENKHIREKSTKFKDILSTMIQDETNIIDKVSPGWVKINLDRGKYVYEYGPTKLPTIKIDKTYLFNKTFAKIQQNWLLHEKIYDSIHGEGIYAERFKLPFIYESDYETESEYDEDCDGEYDVEDDVEYEHDDKL